MQPRTLFEQEIREQPQVLRSLLRDSREALAEITEAISRYGPRFVVIAARGSSDNAARYAQYLFGEGLGWTVALAAPSLVSVYGAKPSMEGALVIGVSQSGQSPDIIAVVDEGRRQGAFTLALTNEPDSPLASAATHTLALGAGKERAVAASKTYLAQLGAFAALCAGLGADPGRRQALEQIPEALEQTLALGEKARELALRWKDKEQVIVLGRGFNYATAFETALKLKETCYLLAQPYSSADFLHGPVAIVEARTPVLLIAPTSKVSAEAHKMLELLAAKNADCWCITDDATLGGRAHGTFVLPAGIPEWLSPLVAMVPGQLLALESALVRGHNPDAPRGLHKITRTR
jgi:glutamine---fructose-6-phosphate transaminase (isomerizing)